MVRVLSAARIVLLRTVKMYPGSITSLSTRLKRDRSTVTRDVAILKKAGLVTVEQKYYLAWPYERSKNNSASPQT